MLFQFNQIVNSKDYFSMFVLINKTQFKLNWTWEVIDKINICMRLHGRISIRRVLVSLQYVQVITTGGTIASLPNESGDVSAQLSGEQLVKRLGIKENIKVKVTSSVTLGSYMFDYETLYQVAVDVIEALENKEVKGVVITHGTDTMEETAYYLSLVTGHYSKPIILTGAQLDASYSYSDGIKNLQDAICAAKDSRLKDYGPLIVFAGFIHAARDVKKIDTSALEGFDSPVWGPIGRVDHEQVIIHRKVISQSFIHQPVVPTPVALIRLAIGMTGEEFYSMVQGYSGVVIEAFGRGNSHPTIPEKVEELISNKIPVVITSRCAKGAVKPIYGNGGGKSLERVGAWFAGDLSGEKARLLLGVMLASKFSWIQMKKIINSLNDPLSNGITY